MSNAGSKVNRVAASLAGSLDPNINISSVRVCQVGSHPPPVGRKLHIAVPRRLTDRTHNLSRPVKPGQLRQVHALSCLGDQYLAAEHIENRPVHLRKIQHFVAQDAWLSAQNKMSQVKGLRHEVGLWMHALLEVGSTYGWRHSELALLRVGQLNLIAGSIRLDAGTTKNNDDGREVVTTKPVRELLMQCIQGKGHDDYVFTRDDGRSVRDFRGTWAKICCAAGLGELFCQKCEQVTDEGHCKECSRKWKRNDLKYVGLLFHDLRRTAVRNMVRAGVPERVAMTISGHKTRSVFDRYHIVSRSDIADAARKVEASQERDAAAQKTSVASSFGQNPGRVAPKAGNARSAASATFLPNELSFVWVGLVPGGGIEPPRAEARRILRESK